MHIGVGILIRLFPVSGPLFKGFYGVCFEVQEEFHVPFRRAPSMYIYIYVYILKVFVLASYSGVSIMRRRLEP